MLPDGARLGLGLSSLTVEGAFQGLNASISFPYGSLEIVAHLLLDSDQGCLSLMVPLDLPRKSSSARNSFT